MMVGPLYKGQHGVLQIGGFQNLVLKIRVFVLDNQYR